MAECIFCRIAGGELASTGVASTERCYAFADLNPVAPVHVLVIPRQHIESVDALGAEHGDLLAELYATVQAAARASGVAESGYRVVANVGDDAMNTVPHLHLHLLGGRQLGWPPG